MTDVHVYLAKYKKTRKGKNAVEGKVKLKDLTAIGILQKHFNMEMSK